MNTRTLSWILRIGAAGCFIGHGAFGVITKAVWVKYFAVAGISEPWAWKLMPWVGLMDIGMGILALVWPCRGVFYWGVGWCLWTALLRPLSDEPFWETLERAGNYGVPLALLVFTGWRGNWFTRITDAFATLSRKQSELLVQVLRWTTATLLAGHAGLGLLVRKAMLAGHYTAAGLPPALTLTVVGSLEFALAVLVLIVRSPYVFFAACSWKVATELLFPFSGAPWWEFIERFGSYTAPLALAYWFARSEKRMPSPLKPDRSHDPLVST